MVVRPKGWLMDYTPFQPSSGLGRTGGELPNLERLGYCRRSLRDRPFVDFQVHFQLQILLALDWQSARCLRSQVATCDTASLRPALR